jgi:hypothetical protein
MGSRPLDTSPSAWAAYYAILDRMDGPARLHAALQLSDAVRELRLAGIRDRHPDLSGREVIARLVAEDYGVALPLDP